MKIVEPHIRDSVPERKRIVEPHIGDGLREKKKIVDQRIRDPCEYEDCGPTHTRFYS